MTALTSDNSAARSDRVRQLAGEQGFALVGIAPAEACEHEQAVRNWIAQGKHGEMAYLANNLDVRLDPGKLLDNARSIIAVADFYAATGVEGPRGQGARGARGKVARYAWGDDYHKIMKKRLHRLADAMAQRWPNEQFRAVVDTAPILEREHAQRAGLGWAGKHTVLIHPTLGSWMLLGLLVTTLALPSSAEEGYPDRTVPPTDHCGTCTRCIDACPTQCITPHSVDASRCISYLTLEHRSVIDPALHEAMGQWIAGCDVCQEVCPYNNRPQQRPADDATGEASPFVPEMMNPRYAPRPSLAQGLPLLDILGWSAEDRQQAFTASALKRIHLDMLKRNALIAAGNHLAKHEDEALRARVAAIAADPAEPELVRDTARQVGQRLGARG